MLAYSKSCYIWDIVNIKNFHNTLSFLKNFRFVRYLEQFCEKFDNKQYNLIIQKAIEALRKLSSWYESFHMDLQ